MSNVCTINKISGSLTEETKEYEELSLLHHH